ncbi:STAS domain-containing protein [Alkalicoccobacillus murimartini]|uniref:RsbT co-antagonist protein RsbR n=1 Tax=Alkalicoccobacillus murimartini TaxID=171685 RepID=A0ABT9YLQ5_9BACI|nr:STAS domain-containing protein [Alkalicoccobacillus murimartini]MDQ0208804.1 rsbT co-antagonist protein RsbR [Alkalicoccobacillus murimartini]
MNPTNQLSSEQLYSLKIVSKKLFQLISNRLNVNTTYITQRGESEMTVLSSFNKEEQIIPEGYSVEYGGTYCRLIIMNDGDVMTTADLNKDLLTKELAVTPELGVKGFLGVTLKDLNGNVFGTLCVMDKEEKEFSQDDIDFLHSMADILSYILELDQNRHHLSYLSVPIIPIIEGVSILTLQGIVDTSRAEKIMHEALHYGSENHVDYFLFDLSKLAVQDQTFPTMLFDIVQALRIMGIEVIITGISPQFAMLESNKNQLSKLGVKTVHSIKVALDLIGYSLIKK